MLEAGTVFGRRWFHNPLAFFTEVLGLEPWSRMTEMACAVRDHNRVAVRAGQKVSKTTAFSGFALWWWVTRCRARFIATSASGRQVKTTIWPEVKRLYMAARDRGFPLGGNMHESPEGGLKSFDGREILGFSSDDPDKFLGLSSPNLFLGIDECSGVLLEIAKAIQGNLSGGGRMLISGNPTQNTGYFYDAFHSKRRYWHCLHIPSTDSPNVTGELGPGRLIPGVAVPDFIAEMKEEYGEDSPFYKIKILGDFAAEEENAFVKLALVEGAKLRWEARCPTVDPLWVGVDPARFGGDPTVAYASRGLWLSKGREWRQQDNVRAAQSVLEFIEDHRLPNEIVNVNVDQSNNNGIGDILRRVDFLRVHDILAQESSPDPKYERRRDHVYACGREWLRVGAIPDESRLHADLLTPKFDWNAVGRVKIESKRDLRKRIGRSTDHGDAALLSVYRYVEGDHRDNSEQVLSDEYDDMPKAAM